MTCWAVVRPLDLVEMGSDMIQGLTKANCLVIKQICCSVKLFRHVEMQFLDLMKADKVG